MMPTESIFQQPCEWRKIDSWLPMLSNWLRPHLRRGAINKVRKADHEELFDDDPEWLALLAEHSRSSIDFLCDDLAEALKGSIVKVYHGCRTADAGTYFRDGIRPHRRQDLNRQVRQMIADYPDLQRISYTIEQQLASIPSEVDENFCYVVLDEQGLIDSAPHYLMYGSELIYAVINQAGRETLLSIGAPTMLIVDLPLKLVFEDSRRELAEDLLREWTRQIAKQPGYIPEIDFCFAIPDGLPAQCIVGHYHPVLLKDEFDNDRPYKPTQRHCAYCKPETKTFIAERHS